MPRPASHGPRKHRIDDPRLFAKVIRPDALRDAWTRVWQNGGAAGGDGITVAHFQVNVMRRLAFLRRALSSGDYRPGPLRHTEIPKPDGGVRPLAIPCVIDRVIQTAVLDKLAPKLDTEFEESSFAYRRGLGVRQAVDRVAALRAGGHIWVVDADIERYFERIPHDDLMTRLAESITDGPVSGLIGLWLEHWFPTGRGVAQGSPISPLLANLYLDRLDEAFAKHGAVIVRCADDFLILCRSARGAEAAMEKTGRLLAECGLVLNEKKTRITDFDKGFRFLGHLFVRSMVMPSPKGQQGESGASELMRLLARRDKEAARRAKQEEDAHERARNAGHAKLERILYIHTPGRRLNIRNHAFAVEEATTLQGHGLDWHELLAVPHQEIDRIEVGPHASVAPEALDWVLATDTELAFVNGHGETMGWLTPGMAPRAKRHLAQAAHVLDPGKRLTLARLFVEGRIKNQRALLRRLTRKRRRKSVLKSLVEMNGIIRRLPKAPAIDIVMGYEGRATALYWPALGQCLQHGFSLRQRKRLLARDPVNIMLNFTASLLARDVAVALARAGLHPGFGALHATSDRRDSAVFDLIEELRAPLAESTVVLAINKRSVRTDMFRVQDDGSSRMESAGLKALIRAYEAAANRRIKSGRSGRRVTWRQLMTEQAQLLAAHVEDRSSYRPYVMTY